MKLIIIIFSLILSGCSSFHATEVDIPIVGPCVNIKLPPKPILPIVKLTLNSKPNQVMKAYVATVNALNDDDDLIRSMVAPK